MIKRAHVVSALGNISFTFRTFIAVLLLCAAPAPLVYTQVCGPSSFHGGQQSNGNVASDHVAIRDALRRGGLREAAKLKGVYIREYDPHWDLGNFNIESLTRGSDAVVVGTPRKVLGTRIAGEGQLILTDYEVSVQEAIKGKPMPADAITVSLIGGRVEFEDGTAAEVQTPEFEHMKLHSTYTFFLSQGQSAPGTYTLAGGPQGLIEFGVDGKVKSHGRESDVSAQEIKNKSIDDFLKEVRKQAKQWPHPGKCCG